jgi:hypothetical protein
MPSRAFAKRPRMNPEKRAISAFATDPRQLRAYLPAVAIRPAPLPVLFPPVRLGLPVRGGYSPVCV